MAETLGPLEMQVLGLLDRTEASTVAEIQARLSKAGAEYAYTTVMTVLSRLHDKGMVRREKRKNRYHYRATARDSALKRGLLKRVQRALFSDRLAPIAALLDEDLSQAELLELRRHIDARLKGKGK
ncbi:MAG: BlaI/MecI/CopY family transcriptional regulator [Myxococcales bacterium]|nr:BlaI/MecI/CopY family transcriptional regulator [Myxococcales bacterium]MCB9581700.1 BlaI/MecI/CopY family transcriptional regulator [Polyangiaceae bacterium]